MQTVKPEKRKHMFKAVIISTLGYRFNRDAANAR